MNWCDDDFYRAHARIAMTDIYIWNININVVFICGTLTTLYTFVCVFWSALLAVRYGRVHQVFRGLNI